jgi:hypothetical protein
LRRPVENERSANEREAKSDRGAKPLQLGAVVRWDKIVVHVTRIPVDEVANKTRASRFCSSMRMFLAAWLARGSMTIVGESVGWRLWRLRKHR